MGIPTITYCETNLNAIIKQAPSAYTNLAYLLVAFLLLKKFRKTNLVKPYVLILVVMGVASFMYHATYTRLWQQMDLGSLFLLSSFFVFFTLKQISSKHPFKISLLVFLFSLLSLIPYEYGPPQTLFGAELLLIIIVQIVILTKKKQFLKVDKKYLFLSILLLIAASGIRWLGVMKIWCDTSNPIITFHGVWHLVTAVVAYLIFVHVDKVESRL